MGKHKNQIESFELVPSSGGVFEFSVNGELVYSKRATGVHADPAFLMEETERFL
ncbi:MAG: Rdx family protein [Synergistales bacterium]